MQNNSYSGFKLWEIASIKIEGFLNDETLRLVLQHFDRLYDKFRNQRDRSEK